MLLLQALREVKVGRKQWADCVRGSEPCKVGMVEDSAVMQKQDLSALRICFLVSELDKRTVQGPL